MLVQITLLKNGWPVVEYKSESNCPFLSYDRTSCFTAKDKEFSSKKVFCHNTQYMLLIYEVA